MAESNENVATNYIKLEDGQVVEGDKAANIQKRVCDIFKEMKSSAKMVLPKTWSEAGITERTFSSRNSIKTTPTLPSATMTGRGFFWLVAPLVHFTTACEGK